MCSIPGGEPESLENDDQLDPEVASYGPSTGPALFLCCCWILIHLIAYILLLKRIKIFLIYDTIASTNCNSVYASCFTLTYTSAAVVPSDPLITTTWYTGLVGDAL